MIAIILGLLAQHIVPVLIVAGGIILAIWQRRAGAKAAEAKQAKAELRARETADEVEDAIAGRSAGENRERLKRWGR